jgi:hypothetical protein
MKNSEEPIATQSPENTTEQAPAALDRGVQATSRNTARSGTPPSWRQTWYRPAIFIGLVGITLSVMLEVTGPDLPDVQTSAVVGEAEAPPRDAVSRTQAPRRQALATESSTAAGETTAGIVGNNIGRENCSDEERSSASAWWQCIEELRRAGRDDAAESELRQLLEDFPKFAIPEDANTSPDE